VLLVFFFSTIGFLWYNVIGCTALIVISLALSFKRPPAFAS